MVITFTAPESMNGLEHSTACLNGMRFADVFMSDDMYVIERNGLQMEPITRESLISILEATAAAYLIAQSDQMDAASNDFFYPALF